MMSLVAPASEVVPLTPARPFDVPFVSVSGPGGWLARSPIARARRGASDGSPAAPATSPGAGAAADAAPSGAPDVPKIVEPPPLSAAPPPAGAPTVVGADAAFPNDSDGIDATRRPARPSVVK